MMIKFRFLKVYFGGIFEEFLREAGDALEPGLQTQTDSILRNRTGSEGKLTLYNQSITTFDVLHGYIFLYFVSFLLKMTGKIMIKVNQNLRKNIDPSVFNFVYYHNRIHFMIFNLFLATGVFLNARSVLHNRYNPDAMFFEIDKFLNLAVLIFYWVDLMELLQCAIDSTKTSDT